MMWKLMTGMLAEELYIPSEHKGYCKGSCGTKDPLLIDETVLRNCKKRH